jgi:hypothetical protein
MKIKAVKEEVVAINEILKKEEKELGKVSVLDSDPSTHSHSYVAEICWWRGPKVQGKTGRCYYAPRGCRSH